MSFSLRPSFLQSRISRRVITLLILTLAILVPVGLRVTSINPFVEDSDEAEYLSIARHLANGDGFKMSIKWHFLDRKPATHSAVGERPLLFPTLLAAVLKLRPSILAGKSLNIALGLVSCLLFYFLARRVLSNPWSVLATLCLALNPVLIAASKTLLSDVLYDVLLLVAILIAARASSTWSYLVLGGAIGLLHLTRFDGILVLVVTIALLIVQRHKALAIYVVAGFLAVVTPYYLLNFATNGSFLYSAVGMNFRLKSFPQDAMTDPFHAPLPSIFEFVRHNFVWVVTHVSYRGVQHFDALLSRLFLSVLAPFALVGYFVERDDSNKRTLDLLFWNALLQFILIAGVWAAPYRASYLLPSFILLLPLSFRGLVILGRHLEGRTKWVMPVFPGIIIGLYLLVNFNNWIDPHPSGLSSVRDPEFITVSKFLVDHSDEGDAIATPDPWSLNALIQKPSILLPRSVAEDSDRLKTFTELYKPKFILIKSPPYLSLLTYRVVPVNGESDWTLLERLGS